MPFLFFSFPAHDAVAVHVEDEEGVVRLEVQRARRRQHVHHVEEVLEAEAAVALGAERAAQQVAERVQAEAGHGLQHLVRREAAAALVHLERGSSVSTFGFP